LGEIKIFKIKFKNLEEFIDKARHILEGEKLLYGWQMNLSVI